MFLKLCGCSESPTVSQVAKSLVKNYSRYFKSIDTKIYIQVLEEIARGYSSLSPLQIKQMEATPMMVGKDYIYYFV